MVHEKNEIRKKMETNGLFPFKYLFRMISVDLLYFAIF